MSIQARQGVIASGLAGSKMRGRAIPLKPFMTGLDHAPRTLIAAPGQGRQHDTVLRFGNARLVFRKTMVAAIVPRPDRVGRDPSLDQGLHHDLQSPLRQAGVVTFLHAINATRCQQRAGVDVPSSNEVVETSSRKVAQFGLPLIEGD